jgi:uncharacterized integral membrane protein
MSKKEAPEEQGISKKWIGRLIGIVIIVFFVALFAVQNSDLVAVRFFPLVRYEISLALLVLLAFCLGVLIAILFSLPSYWHAMRGRSASRNKIIELQEQIDGLRAEKTRLVKENNRLENLVKPKGGA